MRWYITVASLALSLLASPQGALRSMYLFAADIAPYGVQGRVEFQQDILS
jgi:hypothetical protein